MRLLRLEMSSNLNLSYQSFNNEKDNHLKTICNFCLSTKKGSWINLKVIFD